MLRTQDRLINFVAIITLLYFPGTTSSWNLELTYQVNIPHANMLLEDIFDNVFIPPFLGIVLQVRMIEDYTSIGGNSERGTAGFCFGSPLLTETIIVA